MMDHSAFYAGFTQALGFDPMPIISAILYYTLDIGFPAFLIGLTVMVLWHEWGHWYPARKFGVPVPVFSIGFFSWPRISWRMKGTRFQMTPWLFGGYVKINPNSDEFRAIKPWKRAVVLAGGPFMNIALAFVMMLSLHVFVGQSVVTAVTIPQLVSSTVPAAVAGVRAGDHIVTIDGIAPKSANDVVAIVHQHAAGSPVQLVVERGGQKLTFDIKPAANGTIGIALGEDTGFQRMGVGQATVQSFKDVGNFSTMVVSGLFTTAKTAVEAAVGANTGGGPPQLHGILAIVQVAVLSFHAGWFWFIQFLAAVSVNLAFFNLLPIPMLDGGYLMLLAIEKVRGKPVSERVQEWMFRVSLVLLLMLTFYAAHNDILHPLLSH